ncbi:MAG: copper amine oxidase N-terminal domain-containing protein [Defluviitaleaceae bacterium]|nr:copper amine oxidase N-terminal domain-containing protein [Defluviitaleaceae bacterium]
MNDFDLQISPVTDYKAPEIPMFGDNNSDILKKLPSRWQKNAKVIASLGLAGLFALSGCGDTNNIDWRQSNIEHSLGYSQGGYSEYSGRSNIEHNLGYEQGGYSSYSESELLVRIHTGGGGGSGYIVHLTEQEAFGIIRARLEAAGLNFDSELPDYIVNLSPDHFVDDLQYEHGLDLFDAYKGVGVAFVGWVGTNRSFRADESEIARWIGEAFSEAHNDIIVGAFYDAGRHLGLGPDWGGQTPSQAEAEAERPMLNKQLLNQADIFIARLQSEGVLEPFADVGITIDGMAFNYGATPVIVNNHKMVPAVEFFEMLGMEVEEETSDSLWSRHTVTATKDGVRIWISSWPDWTSLEINGEWADRDIPRFMLNDRMMVPLRYVAEAIGADVEWDEEARMFTVTTP